MNSGPHDARNGTGGGGVEEKGEERPVRLFHDDTFKGFFRRLAWSIDGNTNIFKLSEKKTFCDTYSKKLKKKSYQDLKKFFRSMNLNYNKRIFRADSERAN